LDLKLGEIPGWFGRRQKSPQAIAGLFSRGTYTREMSYFINQKFHFDMLIQKISDTCKDRFILCHNIISFVLQLSGAGSTSMCSLDERV